MPISVANSLFFERYMQRQCRCTCQDSSVQQHRDQQMVLGQFQTAEGLHEIIAWKIAKHCLNNSEQLHVHILQLHTEC